MLKNLILLVRNTGRYLALLGSSMKLILPIVLGLLMEKGQSLLAKENSEFGPGYSYEVLVSVHMMDGYVPKYLAECFGGKCSKTSVLHNKRKGDFAYYYHANGSRARVFLAMILPYLKIKKGRQR